MVKTQIQIEEWQYEALKRETADTSRSMADLIREALTDSLKKKKPLHALSDLAGKYRPLGGRDLKRHDAAWADSIR